MWIVIFMSVFTADDRYSYLLFCIFYRFSKLKQQNIIDFIQYIL